jgi:hypothetical protein
MHSPRSFSFVTILVALLAFAPEAAAASTKASDEGPSQVGALRLAGEIGAGTGFGLAALVIAAHHGFTLYFALGPGAGDFLAFWVMATLTPVGSATGAWLVATLGERAGSFRDALAGAYLGAAVMTLVSVGLLVANLDFQVAGNSVGAELIPLLAMPLASAVGAGAFLEMSRCGSAVRPTLKVQRGARGQRALTAGLAFAF